jgi:hypothetical protein
MMVIAEGSLIRETPGRAGAALTKPGRASTVEWPGSGERAGKVYARNHCRKTPQEARRLKLDGYGPDRDADPLLMSGGLLLIPGFGVDREAMVKVCGVAVAMSQG